MAQKVHLSGPFFFCPAFSWYWLVRLIKGHTMPNGDPAQPYAPGLQFDGCIVLPPVSVPDAFHTLRTGDAIELRRPNAAKKLFGLP
jgi:hypothetical protein